jgi:predicted RNA binding protein YcfA (HicA-like mRNA interferase family)
LKAYTGRELLRLLQDEGWRVVRVEGSHHILTKAGRDETLTVPVHGNKDLKTGTLHAILKTAGLDLRE